MHCKNTAHSKYRARLALGCVCLLAITVHCLRLYMGNFPPWGDAMKPIFRGLYLAQAFQRDGLWTMLAEMIAFQQQWVYWPTVAIPYAIFYLIFGFQANAILLNAGYLCVGICSIYGVAARLFDEEVGVLAALIFASIPGVLFGAVLTFREFHAMCYMALALYVLLRTDGFSKTGYSVMFGIVFALAFITRFESVFFLLFPILCVLFFFRRDFGNLSPKKVLINVLWSLVSASVVILPRIIMNFKAMYAYFFGYRVSNTVGDSIGFSVADISTYYVRQLYEDMLGPLYTRMGVFAVVLSVLFVFLRKRKGKERYIRHFLVIVSFIIPFGFFHFFSIRAIVFLIPTAIFSSISIAGLLVFVPQRNPRIMVMVCMALLALRSLAFPVTASYMISECPPVVRYNPLAYMFSWGMLASESKTWSGYIYEQGLLVRADWNSVLTKMIKYIDADRVESFPDAEARKCRVLILQNEIPLRWFQVDYYCQKYQCDVEVINIFHQWYETPRKAIETQHSDYIIVEEPASFYHQPEESRYVEAFYTFIKQQRDLFERYYEKVWVAPLPRKSHVVVYRARKK